MKKLFLSLVVILQLLLSENLFCSDKIALAREISDNAWEITNLIKSNIKSEEVEGFFNELKNAPSSENVNSIIVTYLGNSNATLFNTYADNMLNASRQLISLNTTREEFDDLLLRAYNPNKDENVGGACRSWTAYQQCTGACNGPSAWASHAWTIAWSTAGNAGAGAQIGSWLTPFTGGSSVAVGTLVGGLYGFYDGWKNVGEKYGDCIQKCYNYHCLGIDTNPEGTEGGRPGGGWEGEDKTAK